MRRLVYLAALAAAAPDTDTQLKRAAALARWVDRTGPAPPSWTVAGPKDVSASRARVRFFPKKHTYGTLLIDRGFSRTSRIARLAATGPFYSP